MPKPESLNPAQWEAVYHHEGPLLILAGAGSGKTRVITYRLAELLRRGVSSQRLLVVTFTNKAAAELRQRVSSLLHEHAADREQSPEMSPEMSPELPRWIGTFHSIGARLLRRLASYAGLPASFPILDEDDTLKVCKELIAEAQIDERLLPPRALRAHIDRAKNQGLLAEEYQGSDYFSDLVRKLYLRYEARLKQLGAADFGDLLLLPVRIAEREPSVRALLATRFDHVLVDEFQDVNTVQYRLLKLLADQHRNLAVVGDDDQAIYGWRGADVRLLLDFARDWPDARIVKLEENYRSSQVILDAAHAVVSRNEDRHEKRLYTQRDGGDPVVFLRTRDDRSEAQFVVGTILRMQAEEGYFPEDFAVIYRTNAQSLRFEETLQAAGLPFSLLGGTRFFERAEIKDVLAYLRLCQNPDDELALRRVINVPARQLGQATVDKLLHRSKESGQSLWQVIQAAASSSSTTGAGLLSAKKAKDLARFVTLIEQLRARAEQLSVSALAAEVLDRTGYRLMLSTASPEDEARLQNLLAMLGSIAEEERAALEALEQQQSQPPPDEGSALLWEELRPLQLGDYLSRVALSTDEESGQRGRGVQLMTAHVAKGLEFQVVFVTGLEEGLFPSVRSGTPSLRDNEDQRVVEERRLCYVAMTRARVQLFLTSARQRRLWGPEIRPMEVSRFLRAIPRRLLIGSPIEDTELPPEAGLAVISERHRRDETDRQEPQQPDKVALLRTQLAGRISDSDRKPQSGEPAPVDHAAGTGLASAPDPELRVEYDGDVAPPRGQPVRHAKLGLGRIVAISGGDHKPIAQVQFQSGRQCAVELRYLTVLRRDEASDLEDL
jgi:DNA helicase-2/ATP-dependent DNA helicase PcrA